MAGQDSGDKTEKPSSKKLGKLREKGQIARSRDWSTAIGIFICLVSLIYLMPSWLDDFRRLFRMSFATLEGTGTPDNLWSTVYLDSLLLLFKMLLPLAIVPALVIAASAFPSGWVFSTEAFMPQLGRLNPLNFFKNLFSAKKLADTLASIAKAAALSLTIWFLVRSSLDSYLGLLDLPLEQALSRGAKLMLAGALVLCTVLLVFAFIDIPVQVMLFLRGQKMSKQEVKEEHKSAEGNPQIRQRIRQLQNQIAKRAVRKTVPGADVVIVNPEHYAVALKYDEKRAEAPYVVAKGLDEMALYIREVAKAYAVEIVPLPPLARAIYNTSQVNQQIPAALYQAVARVLSYVLQIKAFRGGRRPAQPLLPDVAVPAHLSE